MNANSLSAMLAKLLDEATPPALRAEIESRLAESIAGRNALAQLKALEAPAGSSTGTPAGAATARGFASVGRSTTQDLVDAIMQRVPPGPPAVYTQIADVVVRAWGDGALREALRRDPRAILEREGVAVPQGARFVVVAPADARLPDGNEIVLPLPPASRPGVPADEAVRRLRETPFGWIWGPPWLDRPGVASDRDATVNPLMGWAATLRAVFGGRHRGRTLAFAGAVAAVVLWITVGPAPGGGDASGTAMGSGDVPWGIVILAVGLGLGALAAIAAIRRR